MNRHLFNGALVLGAIAIAWVAYGFLGTNTLAFLMTVLIGAVYAFGAVEMREFRGATGSLTTALASIPQGMTELGGWLNGLHASLQNPVRLRIEGERVALPGPALTPYLLGLLVMLGMLGTFLGMVVTLNGAVFALEGTSDLQAIRAAFATPIKGLGLAFGTSVAGVASSAMLGLMSALSRRERALAAQRLESSIATQLRPFSLVHQRQETLKALQLQSQALPQVVQGMQDMMQHLQTMGQQLNERLLNNQERFHTSVKDVYTDLAQRVDHSLHESLLHSAQAAAQGLQPVMQTAMDDIRAQAGTQHERMLSVTQARLEALDATLQQRASTLLVEMQKANAQLLSQQAQTETQRLAQWKSSLDALASTAQEATQLAQTHTEQTLEKVAQLLASSEELVRGRMAADTAWTQTHTDHATQLLTLWQTELGALRDEEARRGHAAIERLDGLEMAVGKHLMQLGSALEEPIARLIQTASEAPRAAAEVIGKLRQEVSHSAARDNELLAERGRILETLNGLLESIHHASAEQRGVIDALVASSSQALQSATEQFADRAASEAAKLAEISAGVTSSAVEVSTLGETFSFAVRAFNDGNEKLIASLQRIEDALDKSMARSDDQLAYYVAQAREIIDLSITSQKEVVEELQRLPARQAALADEAA